jgi:hypothetical protein
MVIDIGDLPSSNSEPQPSSSGQYKWQKKMLIEVEHLSKEEREGERLGSAGAPLRLFILVEIRPLTYMQQDGAEKY